MNQVAEKLDLSDLAQKVVQYIAEHHRDFPWTVYRFRNTEMSPDPVYMALKLMGVFETISLEDQVSAIREAETSPVYFTREIGPNTRAGEMYSRFVSNQEEDAMTGHLTPYSVGDMIINKLFVGALVPIVEEFCHAPDSPLPKSLTG